MGKSASNRSGPVAYINARLLDPATGLDTRGALVTEGGLIADVGPRLFADTPPASVDVVDCEGLCLMPGLVDMRVQLREPGEEHKETIETASAAASAGGVTAMACLPNTDPVLDDVAGLEFIARRAREVKATKVFCYAAATRRLGGTELTEMGLLAETGAVAFTDGLRAIADARVMQRALSYAKTFDLLLVQHPEEPSLAADGAMNAGEMSMRLGLRGIPAVAEVIMIERDLRLVEATSGRYHAAHVSTGSAVDAMRRAKQRGLPVTCDTAPPYFTLNETAIGDYRTFAKISPPLRTEEDRVAVLEGLADGTIDAIASDHSPHDQDSKRVPFAQAENGIVGLETLLPLSLALYHNGHVPLIDVLRKLTATPADILRLPLGRLTKGAAADLVLFDLDRPGRIDVDAFRSKSKNSPFENMPVQGQVRRTIVEGRTLYEAD
ncbi:MAG: dihydroorotase [Bauldia litoralis]